MRYKLFIFDLTQALFSKVTILLLCLLLLLTANGLYAGQLKWKEISLVTRGNAKVVQISNVGSFTDKMESVLDRSFKFHESGLTGEGRTRFIFSKLVDVWSFGAVFLVLIYGYFFLIRERVGRIFESLITCPVNIIDCYWMKAASGAAYWAVFMIIYTIILLVVSVWLKGLSLALLISIMLGVVALWAYIYLIWLVYLLVNFGIEHYRQTGAVLLVGVIIVAFLVPAVVQMVSHSFNPHQVNVPYISDSPNILAFIPERKRSGEEIALIEGDLQALIKYREEVTAYLTGGVELEARLAYFSPVLVFQRIEKSLFRPEMIYFREYLAGRRKWPELWELLLAEGGYLAYFGVLIVIFLALPPVFARKCQNNAD